MGADEQMVRGGWFARLQGEVFRLGVPVGTDLSGLREVCAFMCEAAGREAVEAATLFVTEAEIATALENWAGDEHKAGRLANWGRLRGLAVDVRAAAAVTNWAEIKATVALPQDETGPLPPHIARRVELVGRLIAPTQNTKLGPLHRLVAVLIQEAHQAGFQEGYAKSALDGSKAGAGSSDDTGGFTTLHGTGNWPDQVSPQD